MVCRLSRTMCSNRFMQLSRISMAPSISKSRKGIGSRSFFMDIPREIEEAAMIDGASQFGAFIRVIVPIMRPGIIATSLFTLLLAYHEYLLIRILAQSNWSIAVAMTSYIGGVSVAGSIPLQSAAAVSGALPLVIVVLIFQKQLVKGLSAGAVKG